MTEKTVKRYKWMLTSASFILTSALIILLETTAK